MILHYVYNLVLSAPWNQVERELWELWELWSEPKQYTSGGIKPKQALGS